MGGSPQNVTICTGRHVLIQSILFQQQTLGAGISRHGLEVFYKTVTQNNFNFLAFNTSNVKSVLYTERILVSATFQHHCLQTEM